LVVALLSERLSPGGAAAAVFWGIFIGVVPIYGLQSLAAIGVALVFRLNKPLTFAATFINNPIIQPFLVIGSIEIGGLLRTGAFEPWRLFRFTGAHLKGEVYSWVLGSVVLGVGLGLLGALITGATVYWLGRSNADLRSRVRFVNRTFARAPWFDRGFVRWKMRLDRIFRLLAEEGLGSGTVVDLGCGYGIALCFAGYGGPRRLVGCDLDAHRIEVARQALGGLGAELSVCDVRRFPFPPAQMILILDVLQYLSAHEQMALLERCCAALEPGGRLIFRVHDRERGLWSALALGFDRLLFSAERVGTQPLILSAEQYRAVLDSAGMKVRVRRFRNRLPFAHILFVATSSAEAQP
jgi:uncharacterized protein (DUF2062 family)